MHLKVPCKHKASFFSRFFRKNFELQHVTHKIIGRMHTPVREAFSYGIRHEIRYIHCDSMSYDQIRVKPYHVSYRVYHGVAKYGVWYSAECMNWNAKNQLSITSKIRLKLWQWKTNVSHKSHSVYLIKTVNKRGEGSSQSYDNSDASNGSLFLFFFCNKSYMFTKERINDK